MRVLVYRQHGDFLRGGLCHKVMAVHCAYLLGHNVG